MIKLKLCSFAFMFSVIVFVNSHAQNNVSVNSLNPIRLTNVQDIYPMLSPDGKRLAFQSNRTGNWQIYVMDTDGKNLAQLTSNKANDGAPIWSPDGSRILFVSDRDGTHHEIYVMKSDGSDTKRLTNTAGESSHPKWSPDGKRIIFNSARATPDLKAEWSRQVHEIFTMNADGSDVRQVSNLKTVSTYPSFSPDGRKIVFRSVTQTPGMNWSLTLAARNSEIFVMNADGTNPINITNSAAYDGWGAWSPDGTKILFSSNRTGPANIGQLFTVNPDGTNLTQITFGPGSFVQPSWSPDGKKIYAHQHWETEEFGNLVQFELATR